jgi:hypothetical protein
MKVALVCVAKWEDHYLEEWLDYNYKLGFDKIIMYQNDWTTDVERPFLEKRIWDGKSVQLAIYNSFLRDNTEYDWIAFMDCDEFIVLKKHNNIKEFIEEYQDRTKVIRLNWYIFGSGGVVNRYCNSLISMFKKRKSIPDQHIKVLVHGKSNITMQLPHNTTGPSMDTNGQTFMGPFNSNGPMDVAYINHYHNKTKEDWLTRCVRGRVDCNIGHDPHRWDNEINDNIDVEDLSAYNFMYGS